MCTHDDRYSFTWMTGKAWCGNWDSQDAAMYTGRVDHRCRNNCRY